MKYKYYNTEIVKYVQTEVFYNTILLDVNNICYSNVFLQKTWGLLNNQHFIELHTLTNIVINV